MRITLPNLHDPALESVLITETETDKGEDAVVQRQTGWRWREGFDITQPGHRFWYFTAWLVGRRAKHGSKAGQKIRGKGWMLITATVILGGLIYTLVTRTGVWWANIAFSAPFAAAFYVILWLADPIDYFRIEIDQRPGLIVPIAWEEEDGIIHYIYKRLTERRTTRYRIPNEALDSIVRIDTIETKSKRGILTIRGVLAIGNVVWGESRFPALSTAMVDELYPKITTYPLHVEEVIEAFDKVANSQGMDPKEIEAIKAKIYRTYKLGAELDKLNEEIEEKAGNNIVEIEKASQVSRFFVSLISDKAHEAEQILEKRYEKLYNNPEDAIDVINDARKIKTEETDMRRRLKKAEKTGEERGITIALDLVDEKPENAQKAILKQNLPLDEAAARSKQIKEQNKEFNAIDEYFSGLDGKA